MATIGLVDDDPGVLFTLGEILEDAGHDVLRISRAEEALHLLDHMEVLVTDLVMPGMGGMELLRQARAARPGLPVILVTAQGSERAAVQAMKGGAYDYLKKPFDLDEVRASVGRAAEAAELRRGARLRELERTLGRPLLGESAAFRRLLEDAGRVAPRDVPVLLQGETGTGKELIASLLHGLGRRASGPLVRFNCAALPAELAEAELFGHTRGAFTGAERARAGFFAQADGGTLVLDEVGELPLAVQAKLLRALQEGEIQPIGAGKTVRVDARVVASTHRDLRAEVQAGRFREDLYFRLAVVVLRLPPLRERREDIPLLARAFCQRIARRFDLPNASLSPELLAALQARPWPGNVRELENTITRLLALSTDGELDVNALEPGALPGVERGEHGAFRERVAAFERGLLEQALRDAGGNHSEAARSLGLSRVTLLDKLKRHGLRGLTRRPRPLGGPMPRRGQGIRAGSPSRLHSLRFCSNNVTAMTYISRPLSLPRRTALPLLISALGATGCEDKGATAVVVAISAEGAIPQDIDRLRLVVRRDGQGALDEVYDLPERTSLPGTITLRPKDSDRLSGSLSVFVEGIRRQGGSEQKRVFRSASLSFAPEKQKLLRMPLRFSCFDHDPYSAEGKAGTCVGGSCLPDAKDVASLPDFQDNASLAAAPGAPCFDEQKCLAINATSPLPFDPAAGCSFDAPASPDTLRGFLTQNL
jgi:two-component system response regulator AtoC